MKMPAPRRFRIADRADFAWRYWDGEYIFHHILGNNTHRLSDAAGRVLLQLAWFGEKDAESLALACELSVAEVQLILSELRKLHFVA